MVWSDCYCHHSVKGGVQQGEVNEENIPEELGSCPLESEHCINYDAIEDCLNKTVWKLDQNLYSVEVIESTLKILEATKFWLTS